MEENVNVTVTIPKSYATYLDTKGAANDQNRSQVVRALIRKDMIEQSKVKLQKDKKGK